MSYNSSVLVRPHSYLREVRRLEIDPAGRVDAGRLGDGREEDLFGIAGGGRVAWEILELGEAVAWESLENLG